MHIEDYKIQTTSTAYANDLRDAILEVQEKYSNYFEIMKENANHEIDTVFFGKNGWYIGGINLATGKVHFSPGLEHFLNDIEIGEMPDVP